MSVLACYVPSLENKIQCLICRRPQSNVYSNKSLCQLLPVPSIIPPNWHKKCSEIACSRLALEFDQCYGRVKIVGAIGRVRSSALPKPKHQSLFERPATNLLDQYLHQQDNTSRPRVLSPGFFGCFAVVCSA